MGTKTPYCRKEKQCEICEDWFKCGKSNSHFRKPCTGKGKMEVKTEKCRNCNREISKSNFKRHRKACEKLNIKEKDTQILRLYTPGTMYEYMKIMEIKRKQTKGWSNDTKFESNLPTQIHNPEDW
ncbi:hypothetical protein RhiirA4_428675 [Rhizophagus irregularis]|uniref:Uncharacterized protein n=1 Tax=Rhizophagus irregularis TaxID=588596 RepID=A0A2I1HDR3_9GLOM|nr:hypothetical protein RhiirA4_428675 [Rhizophagus irregularis]